MTLHSAVLADLLDIEVEQASNRMHRAVSG
jgi:hypothetical protein